MTQAENPKTWILSDRGPDSTWAYQGHGEGGNLDLIESLDFYRQGPDPFVTVFVDCKIETAMARTAKRPAGEKNYFDLEDQHFFKRVREGYEERIEFLPEIYYIIDSNGTVEETDKQLRDLAKSLVWNEAVPIQIFDQPGDTDD